MSSINKIILVCRLGADPEVRQTQDGRKIVNMRVATSEIWKDKASGERREKTEWHTVVIFNEGIGGVAEKYLRRGSQCYLEGKLVTKKWQDQSGTDRYSTEVVMDFGASLVLLDGKSDNSPKSKGNYAEREIAVSDFDDAPFDFDDAPF